MCLCRMVEWSDGPVEPPSRGSAGNRRRLSMYDGTIVPGGARGFRSDVDGLGSWVPW